MVAGAPVRQSQHPCELQHWPLPDGEQDSRLTNLLQGASQNRHLNPLERKLQQRRQEYLEPYLSEHQEISLRRSGGKLINRDPQRNRQPEMAAQADPDADNAGRVHATGID